jgi:tRNA modification GTPase
MMAMIEADLDFSDESDVANLRPNDLPDQIGALHDDIDCHLSDDHRGQRIRSGIRVAVIGPPNAGKSSLVNHLADQELAIVTDQAGTTRDILSVDLDISGYPVILYDTAGLRDATTDKIEAEGIRRAKVQAGQADITIAIFDGQDIPAEHPDYLDSNPIIVFNKIDVGPPGKPDWADNPVLISVTDNIGLDQLMDRLAGRIKSVYDQSAHGISLTRSRHRNALMDATMALARAEKARDPELMAEDLRLAARHIGSITGQVGVDDVLDKIFSDFCIGK